MIYQIWISNESAANAQAYAQKTEAEREARLMAVAQAHLDSGARPLIICDSGWADEQHPGWGLTAFPNLESRIKLYQRMNEIGHYRENEPAFTLLGTALEGPQTASIQPGLIYSLWVVRSEPAAKIAYHSLSKEEQEGLLPKTKAVFDRMGGCFIITCSCYWANNAYDYFGIESMPSLEAVQEYEAELDKIGFTVYTPAFSILGTLSPLQAQLPALFG